MLHYRTRHCEISLAAFFNQWIWKQFENAYKSYEMFVANIFIVSEKLLRSVNSSIARAINDKYAHWMSKFIRLMDKLTV